MEATALQQRNGVFYAIRADTAQEGQARRISRLFSGLESE
jgi:hypothetical protein